VQHVSVTLQFHTVLPSLSEFHRPIASRCLESRAIITHALLDFSHHFQTSGIPSTTSHGSLWELSPDRKGMWKHFSCYFLKDHNSDSAA